jgi:hypothetical protein
VRAAFSAGLYLRRQPAYPQVLSPEYVGASGDVGIGLGAGANVLIGGSARTVALQPISLGS